MEKTYSLTKSKFLLGFNCSKALWLQINEPENASKISMGEQRILEQGIKVGEYARKQFPKGILVTPDYNNLENSLEETITLLNNNKIIFEGVFIFNEVLVKADILKPLGKNKWALIEVKSSTKVKDDHIPDIAIQKHVLQNCGINITSCKLMLINRECVYPDLADLFYQEDVTAEVNELLPSIPAKISELKTIIAKDEVPQLDIGPQCLKINNCSYYDFCWEHFGTKTIFQIPRLYYKKRDDLFSKGIILIDDIPDDFPLSEKNLEYVNMIRNDKPLIDKKSIKSELKSLQYPLYFLDFETDNPAIPRYNGMHPYDVIPFQFSCHKLNKDGSVRHFEYLHNDETDPRRHLAAELIKCLSDKGSIIAYNASFEGNVIKGLSSVFPDLSSQLQNLLERLWDQLLIFRYYYKHPDFGGSNSIKDVLPVLCPELSYSTLNVKKGDDAQYTWNILIKEKDNAEKERLSNDLKEYCKMDTLAMVEIHKKLLALN